MSNNDKKLKKLLSSNKKLQSEFDLLHEELNIKFENFSDKEIKELREHIKDEEDFDMEKFKNLINKMK